MHVLGNKLGMDVASANEENKKKAAKPLVGILKKKSSQDTGSDSNSVKCTSPAETPVKDRGSLDLHGSNQGKSVSLDLSTPPSDKVHVCGCNNSKLNLLFHYLTFCIGSMYFYIHAYVGN